MPSMWRKIRGVGMDININGKEYKVVMREEKRSVGGYTGMIWVGDGERMILKKIFDADKKDMLAELQKVKKVLKELKTNN